MAKRKEILEVAVRGNVWEPLKLGRSQVKGGVARKRQNGSPSFTRHLTPFILSILHREEEQNGKVEELKNSIVEIRVISLYVNAQCSLLFFYPRSTYKFSRTHLKVFERSRSSWNLKVLVVDERGKPCGVSEGKTTWKTRCTYVCTDCIASAPGGNRTQATVGTGECFHYGVNLLRRHKYGGWKSVLNGQINQRTDIRRTTWTWTNSIEEKPDFGLDQDWKRRR